MRAEILRIFSFNCFSLSNTVVNCVLFVDKIHMQYGNYRSYMTF